MADELDGQIAALINRYIEEQRRESRKEGVDLIELAFRKLQAYRQANCVSNELYSCAEHYLTARYMSSYLSGGFVAIASFGYDGYKLLRGSDNTQKLGLGNDCPASEFTPRQTKWKLLGCFHGRDDMFLRDRYVSPVRPDWSASMAIGVNS